MGPWLPEPIFTEEPPDAADPQKRVEAQESIKLAFLVLLEQLQPFERAVFLLREVFAYEFVEIASMLEKSEAACRRSFSRAKQHLIDQRPRFQPVPETHRQLLTSFTASLAMHNITRAVTLTLMARSNGSVLEAVSSAPVLASEWGIQSPFGVHNNAVIEFLVVLHRGSQ